MSGLFAQGPVITPLMGNSALRKTQVPASAKRALNDTIQLPFIDDFTSTSPYPDARYWADSQVYINNHFPVSPPSYGVATFDNLDSKGRPWQAISGFNHKHSDSLTSNYINLKSYKSGLNTLSYSLADSIYLSFFYQTQGLGDPLDNSDSLVLKFKSSGGFWKTVWKTGGTAVKPFKQVLVGILDTAWLKPDFQFRFINYGKTTGNMNQWHLDYVRMKSGRNRADTIIADVAINAVPEGPLQWYESMPYAHFKASPSFNASAFHKVKMRNNYTSDLNVQFKAEVRNTYNQLLLTYPFSSSSRNVKTRSDTTEQFGAFNFDTLSGKQPLLKIKYSILSLSNDFLPDDYNSIGNNNEFTKTVQFKNYLAYDDGSAEGGYGLDYGSLPAGPGYAAVKFTTFIPDTLRGVSMFFNRSVSDVSFKSFSLLVWKQISEPPAPSTAGDVILRRIEIPGAIYTDSINGFTDIIFDTAVILPQGSFYVGWQQNANFILNIGYDNNYKYAKTGGRNPNLFFNLNGYWEKVSANISGAVMMRPLLGARIANGNTVLTPSYKTVKFSVYPNPAFASEELSIESEQPIKSIKVYDAYGKLVKHILGDDLKTLPVSEIADGIYLIEVVDALKQSGIQKWIKQSL